MKVNQYYDEELDILTVAWGETKHSAELLGGRIVVDFDKNDRVVGFEFFEFSEALEEHKKKMDKIFKQAKLQENKK